MRREFDIFEKFPDGTLMWCCCAIGQTETERKIQELRERSSDEFLAIDIQDSDRTALRPG
jgi:hypothetical protein